MADMSWIPQIDRLVCDSCGDCIIACPTRALALVDGKAGLVDPAACDYCAFCEALCPVTAIALPYQVVLENGP